MNAGVSRPDIAAAIGVHHTTIFRRAGREAWPYVELTGNGGTQRVYPLETLPADVRDALLTHEAAQAKAEASEPPAKRPADPATDARIQAQWSEYRAAPAWRKHVAERRMDTLVDIERQRRKAGSLRKALAAVTDSLASAEDRRASARTLKRWRGMVASVPRAHWLPFLLPEERTGKARAVIHPAAFDAFKRDYLRLEQPAAKACYRRLQRHAASNPAWGELPSLDTIMRRLEEELPAAQIVLRREGVEAAERLGPKIERDRSGMYAMQAVNADGHVFDVAVRFPDGSVGRPVILGWQDMYSGKLLAYRIGKTETSDLVRLSYCDMVRRYGVPEDAYLDNGRAFASKKNTGGMPTRYRYKVKPEDPQGVITRMGTIVHWVTPYRGQAKPIERAWRDIAGDVSKRPEFEGAYMGNSPGAKPENYGSRAVAWDDFLRVVADGVAEFNARQGRRSTACNGRSLDATFTESYGASTIKKASAEQLTMMLLASDMVKVCGRTANVTLAGNRYWSEALTEHMGKRIELRFDPDALRAGVHAFAPDGRYIGEVPCIAAIGYQSSDQLRDARKAQAAWIKAHKALRKAEQARETAHQIGEMPPIADPEPPSAGVVKLHIPKRATAANTIGLDAPDSEPSKSDVLFIEMMRQRARESI